MSTQKRALASTLPGQASLLKRPRIARRNQTWRWSGRNLVPRSWLTEDDVRRVVRAELERAKSDFSEYCRSHIRNALQDVVQRMDSMENAVQKLAEAVELANIRSPHLARANGESTGKNDARNLRLQLRNKLSLPLFTEKKLEGEGGARISVELIDADTGDVVTSGPEASIKLDVVVLEGDFNKDDEENWAPEEFDSYVVKEREGKRPLLTGNLQVKLKAGVGELGGLMFTDNSSWKRSKSFRIGLKVASRDGENTRIREEKQMPFPLGNVGHKWRMAVDCGRRRRVVTNSGSGWRQPTNGGNSDGGRQSVVGEQRRQRRWPTTGNWRTVVAAGNQQMAVVAADNRGGDNRRMVVGR